MTSIRGERVAAWVLTITLALSVTGCGSEEDVPAGSTATELPWQATPLAVTLAPGGSRLFHFVYPGNAGSPSAQFGEVGTAAFEAWLCKVGDCGPAFPQNSVTTPVTLALGCEISADCQIYDPVTPGGATAYWVFVQSTGGASFTVWADGT